MNITCPVCKREMRKWQMLDARPRIIQDHIANGVMCRGSRFICLEDGGGRDQSPKTFHRSRCKGCRRKTSAISRYCGNCLAVK